MGPPGLPFLVAFAIAMVTASSYLEPATKYPKVAGAAVYTDQSFGLYFATSVVAFPVMCSGVTSASTASKTVAADLVDGFGLDSESTGFVLGVEVGVLLLIRAGRDPVRDHGGCSPWVVLWALAGIANPAIRSRKTYRQDPHELAGDGSGD